MTLAVVGTYKTERRSYIMPQVQVIKAKDRTIRNRATHVERLRVAPYCRVSTDSEEQLASYKSQVEYYTNIFKDKPEWSLVEIYADEAKSGTQTKNRYDFNRLIDDAMDGKIDMIITKSISRFARNTVTTLDTVRILKEKGVAVFFEDEGINTLNSQYDFILSVMCSVAEQEVKNTSKNVTSGLQKKMLREELVGRHRCLGYDYSKEEKKISINEKEAEIVRYIFNRYIQGIGCSVIARELGELGHISPRGNEKWSDTVIRGIIRNVKYKGDLMQGLTFTQDPITKRRLENKGEVDQFYSEGHHEAIVSVEIFDKAQEILNKRGESYKRNHEGKREMYSRKYTFSSMIHCVFCGAVYTRRNWYAGTTHEKRVWQCVVQTKSGKENCPDSKGIPELEIEQAFVEAFRLMCSGHHDIIAEFVQRVESTLNEGSYTRELAKVEKTINSVSVSLDRILDMRLAGRIDDTTYDQKFKEFTEKKSVAQQEQVELSALVKNDTELKKRLADFKKFLESNETMTEFDPAVFESMVEKVIIGEIDELGNKNPYKITFVFKTGYKIGGSVPPKKVGRKNKPPEPINGGSGGSKIYSRTADFACGGGCTAYKS